MDSWSIFWGICILVPLFCLTLGTLIGLLICKSVLKHAMRGRVSVAEELFNPKNKVTVDGVEFLVEGVDYCADPTGHTATLRLRDVHSGPPSRLRAGRK